MADWVAAGEGPRRLRSSASMSWGMSGEPGGPSITGLAADRRREGVVEASAGGCGGRGGPGRVVEWVLREEADQREQLGQARRRLCQTLETQFRLPRPNEPGTEPSSPSAHQQQTGPPLAHTCSVRRPRGELGGRVCARMRASLGQRVRRVRATDLVDDDGGD